MGIYFRKSIKVGPFRINLSKSGVGVSTGVKGARVSVNKKGVTVNAGAKGIYYRKSFGFKKIFAGIAGLLGMEVVDKVKKSKEEPVIEKIETEEVKQVESPKEEVKCIDNNDTDSDVIPIE